MDTGIRAVYYVTDSGRRPAEEFVNSLSVHSQRRFFAIIELLESLGRELRGPHAKYIGNEIFELRFEGIEGATRVLYFFFEGENAVLTNGFVKKSNKTPRIEKETAMARRERYFQKYGGV